MEVMELEEHEEALAAGVTVVHQGVVWQTLHLFDCEENYHQ